MRTVFADTSFYIAICNPRDALHQVAVNFSRTFFGDVITTEYVLLECGSAFSRSPDRDFFVELVDGLRSQPSVTILDANRGLFEAGFDLFRERQDKDWSLTDCISFRAMEEHGLNEALTADRHFVQAGFAALLIDQSVP